MAEQASHSKPHRILQLPPGTVLEDPARFQSRAQYPRDAGETDLSQVDVFNHDFASLISVWEDPDDRKFYVVDGHQRLKLAKRVQVSFVNVQVLEANGDADAFAKGVQINLAQWAFERGDKLLWAIANRRGAVERALHTGWLDADGDGAVRLYRYHPDLGRRYSSFPRDYAEAATS